MKRALPVRSASSSLRGTDEPTHLADVIPLEINRTPPARTAFPSKSLFLLFLPLLFGKL
jgi:hypothetical protein